MPRKPNYDFERRERDRIKSEKKAARLKEREKPATDEAAPAADDKTETGSSE